MTRVRRTAFVFALFVAAVMCGCSDTESGSPVSGSGTESGSEAPRSQEDHSPETITVDHPVETAEEELAYVLEKWVDDELVPEEWIPVYTTDEALAHFDEIMNAECSDVSDVVLSLVNKNVLFFETLYGSTFEIEWDSPKKEDGSEAVTYPIKTPYFDSLKSIYDLASGTYVPEVAEELLHGTKEEPRVLFSETDNCLHVNPDFMSKWTHDPFYPRSYIEITDESADSIGFILHYPDYEGLNAPDEYRYFYYDYHYTATNNDGTWLLSQLVIDNGVGLL